MDIFDKLAGLGYSTIPKTFYTQAAAWKSWYKGDVKSFHRYTVFNGQKKVKCRRRTLNMGSKVAQDWANLLMNEKVKITLGGAKEQKYLDDVLRINNFEVKVNEMQEMKCALGTVAYIPRIVGMEIDEDGNVRAGAESRIVLDYVTIENIYPLVWENGIVQECAFSSVKSVGKDKYLYLQMHVRDENGTYIILNRLYKLEKDNLTDVDLKDVKGFERIPAKVGTGSKERQFVIDRPNIANSFDFSLPVGVPVFAGSIDAMEGIDTAYDSYINEFELGKKRIMVKPAATTTADGEPTFDSNDLTFYVLPEDLGDGDVIKEIDMKLRIEEHKTGLQDNLNIFASKCGLGESYYRFENGTLTTATEVVSDNSTLYRNVKKHEIILRSVIEELSRIILRLGNALGAGLNEQVKFNVDFDDSIIIDKETERANDRQDIAMGAMNMWEYRAKWYNEDEKKARASLPGVEELITEKQDEVE